MKNLYTPVKKLQLLFALVISLCSTLSSSAGIADSTASDHPTAAMNGIYTVNPAAAVSSTNFIRIGQADTAMMNNGIDGAVTIQIYNGTYAQANINLGIVPGSSIANTITFTSFSNDSVQTQILSGLSFFGTSNIIIKKLNISNIIIDGNVDNYTITNNQLQNFNYKGGNNLTFTNNYIKPQTAFNNLTNPLPAIIISSKSGAQLTGIVVEGNIFRQVTYRNQAGIGTTGVPNAINFSQISRPTVKNNTFRNINMTNIGYGLIGCCTYVPYATGSTFQFDRCTDTAYIEGNRFDSLSTDRLINDIDISNQNNVGPRLSSIVIRNNFMTVNGTLSIIPYSPGAAATQFYYNNINVVGGAGPVFDASTVQMKNNIFSSVTGNVVFTFSSHPGNADYNDLYTSGSVLAINTSITPVPASYTTFAQYKVGSGSNANGKNVNPKYIDAINLHVLHPGLLAAGTPFPAANPLLLDIDNDNRNQLNPCIGADEFQVPSTDAIAKQFLGSKKDFTAVAPQQLSLKVLNNGGAPLNQLKIRWSINGVEQLPAYTWAGNLAYDSTENINFGSYQFDPMKYTSLKIWTDQPNGVPDMVPANDTLRIDSIMPFARGTFTIGGAAPSLPGFVKAAEYLNYGGVDSAVVISVRDGKYTEQPVMKFARGTSLTNTITYKGESNMAVLDTLSFTGLGTGTVPYATMKLDSAAFVTFKNITFQSLNASNAGEIDISNKSRFITFDSCVFYAASTSGGLPHIQTGTPVADSNFIFTNNNFKNGYNGGIKLNAKNILIKGNRFENINSGNAVDISGSTNDGFVTIDSNYVKNPLLCTFLFNGTCFSYGTNTIGGISITFSGTNNNVTIRKNKIYATSRFAATITTSGSAAVPVKVYNNFFATTNNTIFRNTGAYADIAHNNFADSTNNSANAVEITGLNNTFRNNILAHSTPGTSPSGYYLLQLSNAAVASSFISNYNAYYYSDTTKTFYNGSTGVSLSQWQAATGKDLNSRRTVNAFVLTSGDLHIDKNKPGAVDVFAMGTPLANIPADIDDSTRSTTAPCIGADEFKLNDVDAGAVAISNLNFPVILGANNVITSIRNFGSSNLTSASINWSVNGALQTPYSWAGNLITGDSAVNLNIGSFNFTTPGKYDVRVWTSNPNGSTDINLLNDTAYKAVYPALCGTYTIGGATPSFPTLNAAGTYLSLAGITCPVVFNIRDGIYTESDTLNFVPGTSAVNTVTFQSESLDSSKVVFQQSDYTNANPYSVLRINSAQYLKFKALTFRRSLDPSFHFYFDVIIAAGNASGLSFTNCDISTTGAGKLITANTITTSQDYNFSNNVFTGGLNGILIGNFSSAPIITNLVIKDNKFKKPLTTTNGNSTYTIDVQYAGATNIENNFIDSCTSGYYLGGIQMQSSTGKITILKNTILKRKGINGINLQNITGGGTLDSAAVIANNFVTTDSSRAIVGIYSSSTGRNVKIVYNNILANSTNTSSRAMQFSNSYGTGTLKDTIANNNIINMVAGYAFYFAQGTAGDVNCSNNNIFAAGSAKLANYMGVDYTTLASLPTAGGTNTGNVSKNPLYLSSNNLHVGELSLRLDGKPLSYVATDIDGDTRGLVNTTIGADEIVVSNFDIGVSALVAPVVPFAAGNQNVSVAIKNYGSATITSAVVNWSINGALQAPFNFSGSIPFNTTANAIIANYNFAVDSAYNIKFWTSAPNGSTDAALTNDSLYINNLYTALSGTYTIGGIAPNFRTFTGSSLNLKYGGMLGNVTFNARDGRYNETLLVDSIPFQSSYGVIWQSENNDSSKVTLAYTTAINDNVNGVLQLNKTKNITIRKIGLQVKIPTTNASASYQSLVYFSGKNKNVQLVNNQFVDSTFSGPPSQNTTGSRFFYNKDAAASGQTVNARSADSAVVIDGNYFRQANLSTAAVIDLGGYTTNDFNGNTTVITYLNNITISKNKYDLKLLSKQAINISYADSVKMLSNNITGSVLLYGKDLIVMDRNDIYHEDVGQVAVTVSAIANRAAGKPVIISNNMIKTVRVGTFNGVLLGNTALYVTGDRANIIHNTFATSDSGSVSGYSPTACLYLTSTKLDTVKNNIFYNTNGGYLVYHNAVTSLISNNNDYVYSNHFSNNAASLAAYRTLLSQDAQSVENINPYFRGPKNLHASNILLKAAPTPVPSNTYYTTDVDGQSRGALSCYGADEFVQPANDMVVLDASPKKIFAEGTNDIKIRVYNNGSNPITSFNATSSLTNYVDNGGTPSNAGSLNYNFSGNIAPGAEATITLGQMSIPLFRNMLKVNTTNLNGIGDEVNYDDSLVYDNYYAGLNGGYTFRDYPNVSTASFRTFQDVAAQLKFGGVYGACSLNLLPGIYNNFFYIDSIPNRGVLSPLTIQSANGDSSNTGFSAYTTTTSNLTLYRANNVTIKNLYFGPNVSSGTSAPYQIALGYMSQNISIENCRIVNSTAALTAAGSSSSDAIFMSGNWAGQPAYTDSNYTFKNNLIIGGLRGISVAGGSGGVSRNIRITNNKMVNQYNAGIEATLIRNVKIDSNVVESNSANTAFRGINVISTLKLTDIQKNRVNIIKDGFGIYNDDVNYGFLAVTDTLRITNNFITVGENAASAGIKITTINIGKQVQVLYNSINNRSSSASSSAYNCLTGQFGGRSDVMNNIFFNKGNGIPVVLTKYASATYIHHNNALLTNGAVYGQINGTNYNTLSALSATGVEYSSVTGDPLFLSDTDLHVDGAVVNNTGSYDANVYTTNDIDNEARSASAPDIGADEFKLPNFGAVQLETPLSSCSHSSSETVKAWIKNFGTAPRTNVPVAYRINVGSIVRDTVRTIINPGDSVLFTFAQTANLATPMDYYFDVWTDYRGDSLPSNDTLRQFLVATTPSNNVLPYYTGFEGTNAGWYTGGQNSSFKWGVVFSGVVDSAANGLNAWKSNLTGPHNNNEYSYLYSPCFDLSATGSDPTLNFNIAYQLESNTDKAWIEYSGDGGASWTKLGAQGEGLAWYNNGGNYWTGLNKIWHNAKHTLPISSLGDKSRVRVRFVLQTNGSVVQDGLSIDDISIYTGANPPVSAGTYTGRTAVSTGSATFIPVNDPSGNRLVEINDNGQNLGTITVDVNQNNGGVPTSFGGQTYLGRNWVIHVQTAPVAPVRVRLFLTQAEVDAWRSLDPSVDLMRNISLYKFSGNIEDFSLANNTSGTPLTVSPAQLVKVPYLDGYFVEFSVSSFSEFWLTKAPGSVVVPVTFTDVKASLQNNKTLVTWKVENEVNVSHYNVLHSSDGISFQSVGTVNYRSGNGVYSFLHNNPVVGKNYYRIQQVDFDGRMTLSNVVNVVRKAGDKIEVYPTLFTSTFKVNNSSSKAGIIMLYTADGKLALQSQLAAGTNIVNGSMLAKGNYFYRIVIDNVQVDSGKLIKE
jgi:hypothetical protein